MHKSQSHGKGGDLGSEGALREFGKDRNAQGGVMGTDVVQHHLGAPRLH